MPVKPIPDGYSPVTPYLVVKDAPAALEFYKKAFGAEQSLRLDTPDGKVAHAEFRIGGAVVMLSEESPQWQAISPQTLGGSPVSILLYVTNVDAVFKRALEAGATATMELADKFYGDRSGSVKDPFGHTWHIATHIEDVSEQEVQRRTAKMFAEAKPTG